MQQFIGKTGRIASLSHCAMLILLLIVHNRERVQMLDYIICDRKKVCMYIIDKKSHDFSLAIWEKSAMVNFQRLKIIIKSLSSLCVLVWTESTCICAK